MLIEDDYYSRYALYSLLSKHPRTTVIDEARDVEEAQWLFEAERKPVRPDVILFDVDLFCQDRDPVEAVTQLMQLAEDEEFDFRLVCCMMKPTLDFIRAAVALGVDAILRKEEVASGIAEAVEKVQQGYFVYTRSVSEKAFGRIQGMHHRQCFQVRSRKPAPLDLRLRRVARLYCEDNLTAAEVGEILHLSESGVRRQIRQIYRILGVHSRREARQKLQETT